MRRLSTLAVILVLAANASAQSPQPDWKAFEEETLRHFQALLRFETTDPPGNEKPAADYLLQVLQKEGIPAQSFALEANRPSVVARIKGNGKKRPLLIMGHTDVVSVDAKKWTHPPFSATRSGGYVYGRGAVDDKDNVVAALMTALTLKRMNLPLDRDVIFLFEAGEEGSTRIGIQFMVNQHFKEIGAEYCLAEGGTVVRYRGQARYAQVQTMEKVPRPIELTARGVAGHASVPLQTNAIAHLAEAVAKVAKWRPQIRINDTTGLYFSRLASISEPAEAQRYRDVLSTDPKRVEAADNYLLEHEPRHASMLRTSISPTLFSAGYRLNVIPSEAKAQLDIRALPDEDPARFLEQVKTVINDPAVEVAWVPRDPRPGSGVVNLESEVFKAIEANVMRHYQAPVLPTMSPGGTDMVFLREKGMQCYGIGPAIDMEDAALGFGAHSDQERIIENELLRFARYNWDLVVDIARAR